MESFIKAVSKLKNNKSSSIGKVIEITGNTCKVERENLPTLEDVRLNAVEGDFSNKIIIYPKLGSEVLCLIVAGEKEETAIVQYTEIDRVLIEINGIKFNMDGHGITIEGREKPVKINSNNSTVAITENGIDVISDKGISLNGGFEALYNKVPGLPITDVSQIGISKKVTIG